MTFKRDKQKALDWKKFQKNHALKLIELGVPDSIVCSWAKWYYFLEHGDELESGFSVSQLDGHNAQELFNFLKTEYLNNEATVLIKELENVFS